MEVDLFSARDARDKAIKTVVTNNEKWADKVTEFAKKMRGWVGTGEDFRMIIMQVESLRPTHHNAWGGMIAGLVKQGVLVKTGNVRQMKTIKSHARSTPEYCTRDQVMSARERQLKMESKNLARAQRIYNAVPHAKTWQEITEEERAIWIGAAVAAQD